MAGTAKCLQPALSKTCPGRDPSLEACVLLDPVSQAREPAVHPRFVPLGAAIAPAHHASQEHPTAVLHTDQGPSGVSLHRTTQSISTNPIHHGHSLKQIFKYGNKSQSARTKSYKNTSQAAWLAN